MTATEAPATRMSVDGAPQRVSLSVEPGDALSHMHTLSSSSNLQSPRSLGAQAAGDAATLSFKGASVPVAAEEAEDLLAFLDAEAVGQSRAGFTLRRVCG